MNSAIDISNVVLKTERLIIRPWKLSDLNDFYDYCKVDGVGQWAGFAALHSANAVLDYTIFCS